MLVNLAVSIQYVLIALLIVWTLEIFLKLLMNTEYMNNLRKKKIKYKTVAFMLTYEKESDMY